MSEAERYRRWVLRHWRMGGWSIAVDRLGTKKATTALRKLVSDGLLEQDRTLYRATESGLAYLNDESPALSPTPE